MKAYVCDACNKTITDPHEVKMKEFYTGYDCEFGMVFPVGATRNLKIHLCEDCYRGLGEIAKKKILEGNK